MQCRTGCAACCIAPSISSPSPKHPQGKAAGEPCQHLLPDWRCELFAKPERPAVCNTLTPTIEMCGIHRSDALSYLNWLEKATCP